uniref:16S rRNA (cytidine(1402)-2'-O)-methyltransferase n=1 Tax=Ndongobacter massiliensis TaxID=1871025 RepID=UPI0009320107|nr:16S rRNA (cytidine(1402)-2'-O)-methyltransferase [Ndongobacter massiliensis]
MEETFTEGAIVFVPTPIGNREDLTLRALRVLREADSIACEDTRHTRLLLDYYDIKKPLLSYHQHNENSRAEELIVLAQRGARIAVVSDAGMPGISDPGRRLIRRCQEVGLSYTVLPGPSAVTTAVVACGVGDGTFTFYGFLERRGAAREKQLEQIDRSYTTSVLYESPKRIRATVREFSTRWPNRLFATARELTKRYEEIRRFSGEDAPWDTLPEKGEYVLLVGPARPTIVGEAEVLAQLEALKVEGVRSKEAVQRVSVACGWSKNAVYQLMVGQKKKSAERE